MNKEETARISISVTEGRFEVAGPAQFVNQHVGYIKELVSKFTPQSDEGHQKKIDAKGTAAPVVGKSAKPDSDLKGVVEFDGEEIQLVANMPGANTKEKAFNAALVYALAAQTKGIKEVDTASIRATCDDLGCLDSGNFAKHMKADPTLLRIKGKMAKLTVNGTEKARELIGQING